MKPITDRELEVAKLLAVGKTNGEIGDALKISVKTVDTHRGHVMKKLQLRNNVELCLHAHKWGWVTTAGLVSSIEMHEDATPEPVKRSEHDPDARGGRYIEPEPR